MTSNPEFGKRLKQAREKRGFSQRELAERSNVGEKMIWLYENGQSEPNIGNLLKLVTELSVSADYLLGLAVEPGDHFDGEALNSLEFRAVSFIRSSNMVFRHENDGDHMTEIDQMLTEYRDLVTALAELVKQRQEYIWHDYKEPKFPD